MKYLQYFHLIISHQEDSIWLAVSMYPDDISEVKVSAIEGDEVREFHISGFEPLWLGDSVCEDIKLPPTQGRMAPTGRRYTSPA